MTLEAKMQKASEDAKASGMHPLLQKRLFRPRSVFAPGHRIRMNIVPMFLNVFVPWGVFIWCCAMCAFWVMYLRPVLGWILVGLAVAFWLGTVMVAVWARKKDPEPSWFTYFAIVTGLAVFAGVLTGSSIFKAYTEQYYTVKDLKVLSNFDAGKEQGQNVMDAGIFYFADGNHIDATRSWHFKHGELYCVAPIIGSNPVPDSQSFDFWAVGKDCCSVSSSDFRCGSYANVKARAGIRILNDEELPFYRLAVEQSETLYSIMATHPIFFQWEEDPLAIVNSWNEKAFTKYLVSVAFAFVVALFCMSMATCKFSWLGRAQSVYQMDFYDDADWKKGGLEYNQHIDYHTHSYEVPP